MNTSPIAAIPEIASLCVCIDNARKPDLPALNDSLRGNHGRIQRIRREIRTAKNDAVRLHQALTQQTNSIGFASSDDFRKWLDRLAAALDIIENRQGVE
jgi:hypothetical protein